MIAADRLVPYQSFDPDAWLLQELEVELRADPRRFVTPQREDEIRSLGIHRQGLRAWSGLDVELRIIPEEKFRALMEVYWADVADKWENLRAAYQTLCDYAKKRQKLGLDQTSWRQEVAKELLDVDGPVRLRGKAWDKFWDRTQKHILNAEAFLNT